MTTESAMITSIVGIVWEVVDGWMKVAAAVEEQQGAKNVALILSKQDKYGSGPCPPRIVLLYCPTLFPSFKPNYEGSKSYLLLCSSYPLSLPLIAGDLTTDYEPVATRLKSGFPTDVAVKKELDYC
ncbi:hypothetical protein BHE74_00028192 [Ensete ventricosum]|nr:hypothetical protein BHE74_00028192 [Ensete ventricosum]